MLDLNFSIALSTALAAVFAGISLIFIIRKYRTKVPVVSASDNGGNSENEYRNILYTIEPPHDEKYMLYKIKITAPKSAQILNPNDSINNKWARSLMGSGFLVTNIKRHTRQMQ